MGRLWRLPANTLTRRVQLETALLGSPHAGSVAAVWFPATVRAPRTLPVWSDELQRLRVASEEHGSMRRWTTGELGPACWDSEPAACLLERASRGEGIEPRPGNRLSSFRHSK